MALRTPESKDNSREICKLYACRSGARCTLRHEFSPRQAANTEGNERTDAQEGKSVADLLASAPVSLQVEDSATQSKGSAIKVVRKVGEICRQFQKGQCRWGERCHLRHEITMDRLKVLPHDTGDAQSPVIGAQSLSSTSTTSPSRGRDKGNNKTKTTPSGPISYFGSREIALRRIKEQADAARLARIEQEDVVAEGGSSTRVVQERELATTRKKRSKEARGLEEARTREKVERQRQQEEWAREDATTSQQTILNSIVEFEAGLAIRHLICGFETSQILVKNLPLKTTKSEIIKLFTKTRPGIKERDLAILRTETTRGRQQATVIGRTADLEDFPFDEIEFHDANLEFTVCARSSEGRTMGLLRRDTHHLTISWHVPPLTMVARYSRWTTSAIRKKAKDLNGQLLYGQRVQAEYEELHVCSVCSPDPEDELTSQPGLRRTIKISWIPASTTVTSIKAFAGTQDVKPHYTSCTTKDIFDVLHARLRALPASTLTTFTLEKSIDPNSASVKATFSSWEGAKVAHDNLDGKVVRSFFPPLKLSLSDPYNYILTLSESEYRAQLNQLAELETGLDKTTTIKTQTIESGDRRKVVVTLSGCDRKVVGALKVRIENLATGQRLDETYSHPMLKSADGRKFLASLYDLTGAHARFDWKHNSVTLSGDSEGVEAAKARIREEVKRLSEEECIIPLQRRMLGFFIREGMGKMKALLGEESVTLDIMAANIVLRGADLEEGKHHLKQLVNDFTSHKSSSTATSNNIPCPICHDTVSQPFEISCKHIYCSPCLRHYILSTLDNHAFPLKCMGSDDTCNKPLSIPLIQKFLPPQRFEFLMTAAIATYVRKNLQQFKYCTTPGCSQVYPTSAGQREIQCPSCFTEICASCHDEGHAEITCAAKRAQKSGGAHERLLEAWANRNDVKKCPSCHAWLDKSEGSNHMSCKCGVSFCWICRGAYGAGQMSAHMSEAHGSLYGSPTSGHDERNCPAARPRTPTSRPELNPVAQGHRPETMNRAVLAPPIVTTVPFRPNPTPTSAVAPARPTHSAERILHPLARAPTAATPTTTYHHITPAPFARPITSTILGSSPTAAASQTNRLETLITHRTAAQEWEQSTREHGMTAFGLRRHEQREAEVRETLLRESELREARFHEARLVLERTNYEAAQRKAEEDKDWCSIM